MDLMQSPNIPAITIALVRLAAAQRIPELSEETLAEYLEVLVKCKIEDVEQACEDSKHKLDRFPTIHQLLDFMGIDTGPRTIDEEAGYYFDSMRRLSKTDYNLAVFNVVVSNCIRVMGGRGSTPNSFFTWDQKHEWNKRQDFMKHYKAYSLKYGRQSELMSKTKMVEQPKPFSMTPHERLQSNRAAFECSRQVGESRRTGTNCFDKEKVRRAAFDSSGDEEVQAKYGDNPPNAAEIFKGVGNG